MKKLQTYQCGELKKGAPTFPAVTKNSKNSIIDRTNSWLLFETLVVNSEWLKTPVQTWEENYLKAINLKTIRVVNDVAERGVKLMQDFSLSLTKDEKSKQSVLQVVENHRKCFTDFRKATLINL